MLKRKCQYRPAAAYHKPSNICVVFGGHTPVHSVITTDLISDKRIKELREETQNDNTLIMLQRIITRQIFQMLSYPITKIAMN